MAKKIEKNKEVDFVRVSAIVGVIAVILVASMFVSVSITGNVIRQNNYKYGRYSVYTKEEVDSLIRSVSAGSGSSVDVYEQIRDLVPVPAFRVVENIGGSNSVQCSNTCEKVLGTKCVLALELNEFTFADWTNESRTSVNFASCDEWVALMRISRTAPHLEGYELSCLCEPPANPAGSPGWN